MTTAAAKSRQKAWGHAVPDAQLRLHRKTKQLMDEQIGSFAQLHDFGLNPEKTDDLVKRRRGKAIATMQLYIQKVEGDAAIAEQSFYRINSSAAVIDDTELEIIRGRRKPNAIATRALISAGKGYRYWKDFANAGRIESLAHEGYSLLFGELLEIGPQSPDIPRAGQPYSSEGFKMILDLVNVFNNVTPAMWTHRRSGKGTVPELPDDTTGAKTFEFLEVIVDIARLVSGPPSFSGSLGLEQAVYAYGSTGKIHPAAFIAAHRFFRNCKKGIS